MSTNEYGSSFTPKAGEVVPPARNASPAVVRGFGQLFGLHGSVAGMAVAVDIMVNAAGAATLETALVPLSLAAGVAMAVITFLAQRKFYGDDDETALIKALMMGVLTAIPTSLPNALFIPSAVVGLFHRKRG